MTTCTVYPSKQIAKHHTISTIPGDKSISHRAIIIGSLAQNTSQFSRFLMAEDCLNTLKIFQELGVPITIDEATKTVTIQGVGLYGLKKPNSTLDTGNSGTGIRLITGVLAGQRFTTQITGDHSIQKRPMKRIIDPLSQMGALITGNAIEGKQDTYPPLTIQGQDTLIPLIYSLPVASAQVKSALLFASLYSKDESKINEPKVSRNHTEVMLKKYGAAIRKENETLICSGQLLLINPQTTPHIIPADFSSAAFFIVLGLLLPQTLWTFTHIGTNPTRTSLMTILKNMGAAITCSEDNPTNIEPYGTLTVETSSLTNLAVPENEIPFLIDEIPILAIAALFGSGELKITKAKELRVKESDRISSIVDIVTKMGGCVTDYEDGFTLSGIQGKLNPFHTQSNGDHRIAMSAIIAAIAGNVEATIDDVDCINTSFPNFFSILETLGVSFELRKTA